MSPRWLARVLGAALTLVTAARGAPPTITVSDASGLDADAVRAAVAREHCVEHAVGNLVADLVWVTFCHRFRREYEVLQTHSILSSNRGG